jgi:mono/diheme cytochrome c family protein
MAGFLTRLAGAILVICLSHSALLAADPSNGGRLAERWCGSCHLVAPAQQQASADAPPFATIGRLPGFSAERVAFFLLSPHPPMVDMGLSRNDAQDLAAYIGSLAK